MEKKWISEERKLWDAIFAAPAITEDNRRGQRLIKAARRAGKPKPKLPTEAQVTSRSWVAYRAWIDH